MNKFKPGQKAVCIKFHPNFYEGKSIDKGAELIVRRSFNNSAYPHEELLSFEGFHVRTNPHTGKEMGYDASYFAPLTETTQQFVEVTYAQVKEANPKVSAS